MKNSKKSRKILNLQFLSFATSIFTGISVITLVEVLQLLADLFRVISLALKKFWKLYFNVVADDNNEDAELSGELKNGTFPTTKVDKDLETCRKSINKLNRSNQKTVKDCISFDGAEVEDEYLLNKLTTV